MKNYSYEITEVQTEAIKTLETKAENIGLQIKAADIDSDIVYRAHSNILFSAEKQAVRWQIQYLTDIIEAYESLAELAVTDDQKRQFIDDFNNYIELYKSKLISYFVAMSRCASAFIVGPANFPTERNQKRFQITDKRYEEFSYATKKMLNNIRKSLVRSSNIDDGGEFEKLKQELLESEKRHGNKKLANKIILSRKLTLDEKREKLASLEMIETAEQLLDSSKPGGAGFPSFDLTNSLNRLKTLRNKVAAMQRAEKQKNNNVYNGVEIVNNTEIDRIQLLFNGKPAPEVITDLKSSGWRWSPRYKAWQRQITTDSQRSSERIMSKHFAK